MLPSSTSPRSKPPYLQDQPALGQALLAAVQLLDILTVQVHHQLLGVAADQDPPALGHTLLAAVQLLDILTVQVTIGLIRRGAGLTDVLMHN